METDLELNAKRLEVKNEITEGINKTPMARLFNVTGSIVQKITRYPKQLPLAYSVAVLSLVISAVILLATSLFKTQISPFLLNVFAQVGLLSVVLTYFNVNRVLRSIRDVIVDSITTPQNLSDLQKWLSFGWSSRIIKRLLSFLGICLGVFAFYFMSTTGLSGFGLIITSLGFGFLASISFYCVPLMLLLPIRLMFYQFQLYESDPVRSKVIEDISSTLNRYIFGYVSINALFQWSLSTISLPIFEAIMVVVAIGWMPVTIQYFANQISIRNIVSFSKRRTLNRIQAQIKEFHDGDITSKDNIETINRLMDYHERIRVTPNSGFNIESSLRFLNQLIIPFLGFLLGNIDEVIAFFH